MGTRIIAPVVKTDTLLAWVAALLLAACLFSHTVALRMLLLAAGIGLAAIVAVRRGDEIRALPPIWLPFLLWALWAGLSIAWSVEPARSVKEWHNEVLYTGAALWICYVGAQARNGARIFLALVGAGAVGACAVALYSFSLGFNHYQHGWHGGPGNHSSALLTLMPCAAIAGWYAARHRPLRWAPLLAAGVVALFLASAYATVNRTIWLGLAVEAMVVGGLVLRRGAAPVARPKLLMVALAATVLAASAAMLLNIQAKRDAIGAGRALEDDLRFALWPEIVELIGERPLTGYGFGRGLLRSPLKEELGGTDNLWHAHNLFLEVLLQMGLPGLFLLGLLLAAVVRVGWRLSASPDPAATACGAALLAMLAGMLVRNMTDTLFVRQNSLLFWGVAGVLMGLAARRPRPG